MKARGVSTVVECGPGKVLSGLVKRIDPSLESGAIDGPAALAEWKSRLA